MTFWSSIWGVLAAEFTFSNAIGIAGLAVSLYTFVKVKKVASVQIEERQLTQELLGIEDLEIDLREIAEHMGAVNDEKSRKLASAIYRKLGVMEGVGRALKEHTLQNLGQDYIRLQTGFMTAEFLRKEIRTAKREVDIVMGSYRLFTEYTTLEAVRGAASRGVRVRLIGFNPRVSNEILEDAVTTVAYPGPRNAEEYRRSLLDCERSMKSIVDEWNDPKEREKFEFRCSKIILRSSFIRVDNCINLGFVQFIRDAQPSITSAREYVMISTKANTGKVIQRHFEYLWDRAKSVDVPGEL